MEASAAKLLVPQSGNISPSLDPGSDEAPSSSSSSSMEEFSRQLEDILSLHGSASTASAMEEEEEEEELHPQRDISDVMQSLSGLSSPAEKLEELVKKHIELMSFRRCEDKKLLKLKVLQEERRSSIAARCKLETLCRKLQEHYNQQREETLQRCREEEEKRSEITFHFQNTLTEIQAQIEQHNNRNDNLCLENANLTEKLESLMSQCDLREESMEKIDRHRDLQHKLTDAKLQQANAQLAEAEEKHKREKEYLLREAIDKTKKCCNMKEQELSMKKKLTLYAQKFDEFQATLAKSNEIYVHFKKEMEKMSEKMKTLEKESNSWKTRFENCNKTLTDMIVERNEKGQEYELFVLKIQKLERLCRALQEERVGLYEKIKEVRLSNADITCKIASNTEQKAEDDGAPLLTSEERQEIEEQDSVLTEDMSRLRAEQAKLEEFAASLLATPFQKEEEEDLVASAFAQLTTKTTISKDAAPVSENKAPEEGRAMEESSPKEPTMSDQSKKDQKPDKEEEHEPKSSSSTESPKDQNPGKKDECEPKSLLSDKYQTDEKPDKDEEGKPKSLASNESQKEQKPNKEDKGNLKSSPSSDRSKAQEPEIQDNIEVQVKPKVAISKEVAMEPKEDEPTARPTNTENLEQTAKVQAAVNKENQDEECLHTSEVSASASSPKVSLKANTSAADNTGKLPPKKKKKRNGKNAS